MHEISPLDILGKSFRKSLHGFAPEEVSSFLTQIAGSMEALLRERGELKQRVHRLEQELSSFRQREGALQEALVAAQQAAEGTLRAAQAEGQRLVNEGQTLADRLIEDSHQRAQNIEAIIGELRGRRREARSELGRLVEVLEGFIRDDQQRERDEVSTPQLAVLRRRKRTSREGPA